MKKLLPYVFGALFPLFMLAVAGGVMYYSYRGLGLIFPNDLSGQLFGLTLFDVAAFIWFGVFISKCKSTMQYVFSLFGFLIGLVGTVGLILIEIGLSTAWLDAANLAQPLTYIFVGVLIGHLVLLYAFHGAAPETSAEIAMGIEKAKITDRARAQAERALMNNSDALALPIANDLVVQVAKDLNLRVDGVEVIDGKVFDVARLEKKEEGGAVQNFFSKIGSRLGVGGRKSSTPAQSAARPFEVVIPMRSPVADDAGLDAGGGNESKP